MISPHTVIKFREEYYCWLNKKESAEKSTDPKNTNDEKKFQLKNAGKCVVLC